MIVIGAVMEQSIPTVAHMCGPKNFNVMSKNLVPKILLSAQKFQFSAKKLNLVPKNFNSVPKKFNLVPKSFKFSAAEINSAEKIKNSVEKNSKTMLVMCAAIANEGM